MRPLSRRRFGGLVASTLVTSLAGCSGGGDDTAGTSTPPSARTGRKRRPTRRDLAVADLGTRSLFVVSRDDDDRAVRTARTLCENPPRPTELAVYEGSAHGQRPFDTDHGAAVCDRVSALVSTACARYAAEADL